MDNNIKISVLIANFNNAIFLDACIKSVVDQSLPKVNFEIIVCDDASTDDSLDVLQELQNVHNFQLLNNLENMGVGATKRRLIEKSKGDWFIFVDSDDKITLNCLHDLIDYIKESKNESLSMVYANSMRLEEIGNVKIWKRSKIFAGSLLDNKFNYPIFHPIIYNRVKYNLTEGIDINMKSADDYDLWYKMEEVGDIEFFDRDLYFYRINLNGVSQVGDNLNKWIQVMLEHSLCSANAAKRRGKNVRRELDEFAEVILRRVSKHKKKPSFMEIMRLLASKIKGLFAKL